MDTLSPISPRIPFYGSRLVHGQENPWKTTWRSYGRLGREFGYLVTVHENITLRAAVHLEKTRILDM